METSNSGSPAGRPSTSPVSIESFEVRAKQEKRLSPLLRALHYVSQRTTGDVRVHVSRRRFEKDPMAYALRLFERYRLTRTAQRNAVLVYLNLASRKFAIVADEGLHRKTGQKYWDELAMNLREDLQSTYFENALAMAVFTLGYTLEKHFPAEKS